MEGAVAELGRSPDTLRTAPHTRSIGRPDEVRAVNAWAIDDTWPDLVILLTVPADVAAERMSRRELDRFEQETVEFFERVRQSYLDMARDQPERYRVIDASQPLDRVQKQLKDILDSLA